MKMLTVKEQYDCFKATFAHCGLFLLELDDEYLLCHLFEEFDIDATSFLHTAMLDILLENGYINEEIALLCQSLRDRYFKLTYNTIWRAEEIRISSDWLDLFGLADRIRIQLI